MGTPEEEEGKEDEVVFEGEKIYYKKVNKKILFKRTSCTLKNTYNANK